MKLPTPDTDHRSAPSRRASVRRRAASSAAALVVAGAALASASPASAHTTDDWLKRSSAPPSAYHFRQVEDISPDGDAWGEVNIRWSGYHVVVSGRAEDLLPDGKKRAVVQIRYQIYLDGEWSKHWHYRNLVQDTNSKDGESKIGFRESRYPTQHLTARVCSYRGTTKVRCTDWS